MKKFTFFFTVLFCVLALHSNSQTLNVNAFVMQNVSCAFGNDGFVQVNVTGGSGTYQFSLSGGPTSFFQTGTSPVLIPNVEAGNYTVNVSDASSPTDMGFASFTVTEPPALVASASATDVSCNGGSDGSATASEGGGTSPYTYLWNTTETTKTINALTAGTYAVTVTDANNCTVTAATTVTEPPIITLSTTVIHVTINGGSNGGINLSVNGGKPGYSYAWDNASTTQDITNLTAGTYNVTVTDAKGCTMTTAATVTEPAPGAALSADTLITHEKCPNANDGKMRALPNGGTPPYDYNWSTGETTQLITGLTPGQYDVTITDAAFDTYSTGGIVLPAVAITLSTMQTDVSVNGGSDGSIDLMVSGGKPGYSYSWDNGETTEDLSFLSAGTYNVTVSDANGCLMTTTATITEPAPAIAMITPNGPTTFCVGGSVDLTANDNGGPADTYTWSTGETTATITASITDTYTVTVTNVSGGSDMTSVIVTVNSLPVAQISPSGATNICSPTTVDLTASDNGSPADTYIWSTGETIATITASITDTYVVTITNVSGCSDVINQTVTVSAGAPAASITPSGPTTICIGSSITLTALAGGDDYAWSSGETTAAINLTPTVTDTYTVTISNACGSNTADQVITVNPMPIAVITPSGPTNICSPTTVDLVASDNGSPANAYNWSTGETTATITASVTDTYTVTITNVGGCDNVTSQIVTVSGAAPFATIVPGGSTSICAGNSVTLTATAGVDTYNWSTGETTATISASVSDTYVVTVTNACGSNTTSEVVTVNPLPIALITPNGTTTFCAGGSVDLTASDNGSSASTYLWSTGETTATISALTSDTYIVTITNASGCSDFTSQTVTVNPLPQAMISGASVLCPGVSSIILTASDNGSPAATYSWSTGETTDAISVSSANTYAVTITNANSCSDSKDIVITTNNLSIVTSSTDATCPNNDGTASIVATGGSANYTYLWSNAETNANISGLSAGVYTVTVDDGNCTATGSLSITAPAAYTYTITPTHTTCGNANGGASVTITGGTLPYSYAWDTGETSNTIQNVAAGTYTVTITASGCSTTGSVTINSSTGLQIIPTPTHIGCQGGANGAITLLVGGGSGSYTYLWSNNATSQNIAGLVAGTYAVTVDDGICATQQSVSITEPTPYSYTITAVNTTCGNANGKAYVTITGGSAPYGYLWSIGTTSDTLFNAIPGSYTVTITASGCSKVGVATINFSTSPQATTTATDAGCTNDQGTVSVTASSGTSPYTYVWNTTATTTTVTGLSAGTYTVTVTDAVGCTVTALQSLSARPIPPAQITPAPSDTVCKGVLVRLTATGGSSYIWNTGDISDVIFVDSTRLYTVTVTNSSGCTASAEQMLTIQNLPTPSITANGPTSLCPGGTVTLTASGGVSYKWSTGSLMQSITVNTSNTYVVTVTNANGCTATVGQAVTVNTIPTASIAASGTTTFCIGGEVDLTASGGATFLWSTGATTAKIIANTSNTYIVTVTSNAGCSDSTQIVVKVNTLPTATITANGPTSFCKGGMVTLTAAGGSSYLWSTGDTKASITVMSANTYTVTVTNSVGCTDAVSKVVAVEEVAASVAADSPTIFCEGDSVKLIASGGVSYVWSTGNTEDIIIAYSSNTYTVTVTSASGCKATANAKVTVINAPDATVSASRPTTICSGESVILSAKSATGYIWSNGTTDANLKVQTAGFYSVTVTNANACTASSQVIEVKVNPLPNKPTISVSGKILTSSPAMGYQWLFNEQPINGATQQSYTAAVTGYYRVLIADSNGCNNKSDSILMTVVGIAENTGKLIHNVSAYPNPFNNILTIKYYLTAGDELSIELMDITGKQIAIPFKKTPVPSGEHELKIDANDYQLRQGFYLIKIATSKGSQVLRVNHIDNQ